MITIENIANDNEYITLGQLLSQAESGDITPMDKDKLEQFMRWFAEEANDESLNTSEHFLAVADKIFYVLSKLKGPGKITTKNGVMSFSIGLTKAVFKNGYFLFYTDDIVKPGKEPDMMDLPLGLVWNGSCYYNNDPKSEAEFVTTFMDSLADVINRAAGYSLLIISGVSIWKPLSGKVAKQAVDTLLDGNKLHYLDTLVKCGFIKL